MMQVNNYVYIILLICFLKIQITSKQVILLLFYSLHIFIFCLVYTRHSKLNIAVDSPENHKDFYSHTGLSFSYLVQILGPFLQGSTRALS